MLLPSARKCSKTPGAPASGGLRSVKGAAVRGIGLGAAWPRPQMHASSRSGRDRRATPGTTRSLAAASPSSYIDGSATPP